MNVACGVDLRLVERLDRAERADERRVLLQADEVVQERRDHAPHRLRQDHVAAAPASASARASARPPPATGAPTRSRRGRPRRRTPCRRARARRSPRTTSRSARPSSCERRRAEAEHRDHEDRRHAAEEVGVDDRERAQREEHRPRAGCGSPRAASAKTRMNTSAMQKIFTLSRNALRDLRERAAELAPVEEGLPSPRASPATCVTTTPSDDEEDDACSTSAISDAAAAVAGATTRRGRCELRASTSGPARRSPSLATAAGSRFSVPFAFSVASARSTQRDERVALREDHPEVLAAGARSGTGRGSSSSAPAPR